MVVFIEEFVIELASFYYCPKVVRMNLIPVAVGVFPAVLAEVTFPDIIVVFPEDIPELSRTVLEWVWILSSVRFFCELRHLLMLLSSPVVLLLYCLPLEFW